MNQHSTKNTQYNILIIDNNELNLLLLDVAVHQVLPVANVSTFFSSLEAIDMLLTKEIFGSEQPHLLIINANIEKLDIVSTINLLMKNQNMHGVPLVIINDGTTKISAFDLPHQGKYSFHSMPKEMDDMIKMIEEIWTDFLSKQTS
jgi:DNA-binding NtrC family response regulator